jgi:hypothetical protein
VTALPPDPDPKNTPGIEHAGGVPPGETPPDSAQTSAGNPDPAAGRNLNPRAVVGYVLIGLFIALFAVIAVVAAIQIL